MVETAALQRVVTRGREIEKLKDEQEKSYGQLSLLGRTCLYRTWLLSAKDKRLMTPAPCTLITTLHRDREVRPSSLDQP